MGLPRKTWLAPLLGGALVLLYAPGATAQSRMAAPPAPTRSGDPYGNRPNPLDARDELLKREYMPQKDAFETAGEQAAFMGAYQMWYGPYGTQQNPTERAELLKKTSAAIEECVRPGGSCDGSKQELVLKALIQYNMGQDIKRMMLTNATNANKMKSIENMNTIYVDGQMRPMMDQNEMEKSLRRGKDFDFETPINKDGIALQKNYRKLSKEDPWEIPRNTGSAKDPYFQLNEQEVQSSLLHEDAAKAKNVIEREILGDDFFREYGLLGLGTREAQEVSKKNYQARFHAFKPAGDISVYDEKNGQGYIADPKTFVNRENEQKSKTVAEAMKAFRENQSQMRLTRRKDGKYDKEGGDVSKIGVGEQQAVDPAHHADLKFDDLKNPETGAIDNSKAIARVVNKAFQQSAEKSQKAQKADRAPSSSPEGEEKPKSYVNITLSADDFGNFLDEIWPTPEGRRKRLATTSEPEQKAPGDEHVPQPNIESPTN